MIAIFQKRRYAWVQWLLAPLVISLIFVSCEFFPFISRPIQPPDIDIIGNSQVTSLDIQTLSDQLNLTVGANQREGMWSAWQFAALWHSVRRVPPPRIVVICTDLNFLTSSMMRTTDFYRTALDSTIANDSRLRAIIDSVLLLASAGYDSTNFAQSVPFSFLPLMLQEAENAGTTLIISRFRNLLYVNEPMSQQDGGEAYRDAMARYVLENGGRIFDFSQNPRLTFDDYADRYHLNEYGKQVWTGLMAMDLKSVLAARPPYDERLLGNSAEIQMEPPDSFCRERDTLVLSLSGNIPAFWSFLDTSVSTGEQFLDSGMQVSFIVPVGHAASRTLDIYGYAYGRKYHCPVFVMGDSTINRPPHVEAGPELNAEVNKPLTITGKVYDDTRSGTISVKWAPYIGTAIFDCDTSLITSVKFTSAGPHSLRLTVSDGQFESYDILYVYVNNASRIAIASPTSGSIWHAGQTEYIRWAAPDVENIVIECSYDGGISFSGIFDEVIVPSDPRWGNAPWTIPDDAPQTNAAIIRLSDYWRTTTSQAGPFSIVSP